VALTSSEGRGGGHRSWLLATVAAAVAIAGVVGVSGNFPLSDDWAFAHAARRLAETGRIELLPWTGASVVFQAAYGALLTSLFGFSFTVLRASTLVLATSGAVALVLFLRECGIRGELLALAAIVLALDPLYVNLAFTFMTDVPFTALALWAAWLYARGLRRSDARALVAGSIAAAAALLVRQHGVFVAAAAVLAILLTGRGPRVRHALAAAAAPLIAFACYLAWLYFARGATPAVANKVAEAAHLTATGTLNIAFRALEYVGLLLAPVAVAAAPAARQRPTVFAAVFALLAACAGFLYVREGALMFYLTNVVYDFGVGAVTLRDVLFLGLDPPLHAGPVLGVELTGIATTSAAVLVTAGSQALPRGRDPVRAFVFLSFALLFLGSLLHARFYFDRYLLPVLPFAAALALTPPPPRACRSAWILAIVLAWCALAGTHDYMAWNRARFAMLDALESEGVEPTSIDGGMEYNAWRLAARLGTWPTTADVVPGQPSTRRSWWWVVDDRFVVSFRLLPGYKPKAQRTYRRWLIPGRGRVLLLERASARAVE
jgi:4-amino-4-deoxy-L-arabinose transferase-like glycosyltransferase